MRIVVVILALLAIAKIASQEYLTRSALQDAVVAAYRERATRACDADSRTMSLRLPPNAWNHPREMWVMVGKSQVGVWPWQVTSEQWDARYRNPYIVLSIGLGELEVRCEYDIVGGIATVQRT